MPWNKNRVVPPENDLPGFLYTISRIFFSTQKMGEKKVCRSPL
jgi:hypothetical protein